MTAEPVQEPLRRGRRGRAREPGVLRRGLAVTPELRQGIRLTVLLALLAGAGRMVTPVLVQQGSTITCPAASSAGCCRWQPPARWSWY